MRKLDEKIAVITGGNSGIGFAAAKEFKKEGATLVIVGRDKKSLDAAGRELDAFAVQADISKMDDLDRLYSQVKDKYGRIDVLYANAGVANFVPIEKMTPEEYYKIFDVNVKGTFFTIQKAIPLFSKGASVILTTSIANQFGRANVSVYAASKAAVRSLALSFSAELVGRGVRVNAISPGATETPIITKRFPRPDQLKVVMEKINAAVPMKRIAQPEEIAKVAVFLASDDSAFFLGQELVVDGGISRITSAF